MYDGRQDWQTEQPVEVAGNMDVTAYYPFSPDVTSSESIPFDINAQNDLLYGFGTASRVNPQASPVMNHALTLIHVIIKRKDYSGKGEVSDMSFTGVHLKRTMNALTGEVIPAGLPGTYKAGGGFVLNDDAPVTVETILMPMLSARGASLSFEIDGKEFTYEFPDFHT